MSADNKIKILIIVAIVVAILGAFVAGGVYYLRHKGVLDGDGMIRDLWNDVVACTYSESGGMDGSITELSITTDENGTTTVSYYHLPEMGAQETVTSRSVPDEAIFAIRRVCKEYGVFDWGDLPASEIQLLDAPTTRISFHLRTGEIITISDDRQYKGDDIKIFGEIYEILDSYK